MVSTKGEHKSKFPAENQTLGSVQRAAAAIGPLGGSEKLKIECLTHQNLHFYVKNQILKYFCSEASSIRAQRGQSFGTVL